MIKMLWRACAVFGLAILVLWAAGTVGVGDFKLYYGRVGSITCIKGI